MINTPYKQGQKTDDMFRTIINTVKKTIQEKNDHYVMFCFGETGTGKSSLALHAYELYDPFNCSVEYVGFDQESFANALRKCKEKESLRFIMNDEANISKRQHSGKWNRQLIDLYFAIRGMNIFHWWNNPSVNMIDKPFIEEVIKGYIYITGKNKGARPYYFFTRTQLLEIFNKHGDLKPRTMKKELGLAYYKGWFKKYDGELWESYVEKKEARMNEKIESFWKEFGGERTYSLNEVGNLINLSTATVKKYLVHLDEKGRVSRGKEYNVTPSGYYQLTDEAKELIRDYALEKSGASAAPILNS